MMRRFSTLAITCLVAVWSQATTGKPAAAPPAGFDSLLAAVGTYTYGQDREALVVLEEAVHAASGSAVTRAAMAAGMAEALATDITLDAKRFLCRQLSLIGSAKEVPALVVFLSKKELGLAARSALERIPGDAVNEALRSALPKCSGLTAQGVINALGNRCDEGAVNAISTFLGNPDPGVTAAAASALGRIGGETALALLLKAKDSPAMLAALLDCADELDASELTTEAYVRLSQPDKPSHVRLAAFPGLIASRGDKGAAVVLDALAGKDRALQRAAIRSLASHGGTGIVAEVAERLPDLDPRLQVQIISALNDGAAMPAVRALLSSANPEVQAAAIAALGRIGDASAVEPLAGFLTEKALGKAAFLSLTRLEAPGVQAAIVDVLESGSAAERAQAASVLRERAATGAVPVLLRSATDEDTGVAREAVRALGALASASDVDVLIGLMNRPDAGAAAQNIESAIVSVCKRHPQASSAVVKAAPAASGDARLSLLSILGRIGGDDALALLRTALRDTDVAARTAAVKALSDWADADPLPDVVALIRVEKNLVPKALAIRGFVQLSAKAKENTAGLFTEVMDLADRPGLRKTLIGGLGNAPSIETLRLAVAGLADEQTVNEAALATMQIAPFVTSTHGPEVKAAIKSVLAAKIDDGVRDRAGKVLVELLKPTNLARTATASSPDGLEPDHAGRDAPAAIDGDHNTYWDETDGKDLYVLKLEFEVPVTATELAIVGFDHHQYAPKDFEIVCDGKMVKKVAGATYVDNKLTVSIPRTTFRTVELRITKYYPSSPAIRELEIYDLQP